MNNNVRILKIIEDTTVDGPGFRISVYSAGCSHKCNECHNPESWNINNGDNYSINDIVDKLLKYPYDITFTGGDPLFQVNEFTEIAKNIKAKSNKNIWLYTGYTYEEIVSDNNLKPILDYIDILVDGKYKSKKKQLDLLFRGSSNQRLIDVKRSLENDDLIIYNYNPYPKF